MWNARFVRWRALALTAALVLAGCPILDLSVIVLVSPQTILLGADQGGEVTVHAEIAYRLVEPETLRLNGVYALSVGSDSRGELVAKFSEHAIKAIVSPPSEMLMLTGRTTDGRVFAGMDEVVVREW